MKKITISLQGRNCQVYIGVQMENLGAILRKAKIGQRALVVSDKKVAALYGEKAVTSLRQAGFQTKMVKIMPGEKAKTFDTAYRILLRAACFHLERTDVVIGLGGGVTCDLAGFVASIYLRGVNYVSVPTTLLAQVDAAIGGKTGVDLPCGKNLVGTFYQPQLVWIDVGTLSTLSSRQIREGLAELIKYGMIKEPGLFSFLERIPVEELSKHYQFFVETSVKIKGEVVEEDEKEISGAREILNFGHTLGHGIEMACLPRYTHGEAVALGMVGETYLAVKAGLAKEQLTERLIALLQKYGLAWNISFLPWRRVLGYLQHDKKVRKGRWRFVLPRQMGRVIIGKQLTPDFVKKAWLDFSRRYKKWNQVN